MRYLFLIFFLIVFTSKVMASIKNDIIQNLQNTKNLSFNFEQNINGKLENGICTIEYPKKIFCEYYLINKKILVSNGRSLVIKTNSSFYIYPIEKTPLNLILDKDFLLKKIKKSNERILDDNLVNFRLFENDMEINVFFDKQTSNLVGWQTVDIYQNLSITFLSFVRKNKKLEKDFFKLPERN